MDGFNHSFGVARLRSTHGQQRNLLVAFIVGNAGRVWIEHWLSVHEESVLVVAMRERHLEEPPTVHAALHGVGGSVPTIEIADQVDGLRLWGVAIKVYRFGHFLGQITGAGRGFMQDVHGRFSAGVAGSRLIMIEALPPHVCPGARARRHSAAGRSS